MGTAMRGSRGRSCPPRRSTPRSRAVPPLHVTTDHAHPRAPRLAFVRARSERNGVGPTRAPGARPNGPAKPSRPRSPPVAGAKRASPRRSGALSTAFTLMQAWGAALGFSWRNRRRGEALGRDLVEEMAKAIPISQHQASRSITRPLSGTPQPSPASKPSH